MDPLQLIVPESSIFRSDTVIRLLHDVRLIDLLKIDHLFLMLPANVVVVLGLKFHWTHPQLPSKSHVNVTVEPFFVTTFSGPLIWTAPECIGNKATTCINYDVDWKLKADGRILHASLVLLFLISAGRMLSWCKIIEYAKLEIMDNAELKIMDYAELGIMDYGAVHKVCHAFFDDFWPPLPLSQTVTNLGPPPPKSMSHFWTKS